MENNQLLPFERNRYYVGKLLTSADFLAEQVYGSHKRRFLNEMMFGSGIVCGLGVYSLDDQSLMIDSGAAVDGFGREIVLESSVVKKLSAVEGFEELTGERAMLCLAYREESVHPVYAIRGQESGENYEHNRIREGWSLLLRDSKDMPAPMEAEPEFLSIGSLYADDDYEITCAIPAQCACGSEVRLEVTVRRLDPMAEPLSFQALIQTPAFLTEEGGRELRVELSDFTGEDSRTIHYWLTAQTRPAPESALLVEPSNATVRIGERVAAGGECALRCAVVELTEDQIIDRAAASVSLELRQMGFQELVPLAEITMQRTRRAYLIEKVDGDSVRRYIPTAASTLQRRELKKWFRQSAKTVPAAFAGTVAPAGDEAHFTEPLYATGTCEIPLPSNAKRGQIAYSDEIIHGLGPGTVFVSVGVEYLAEDSKLGDMARNTIYGNAALFPQERVEQPRVDTAIRVLNDRGSFVVAAQLQENTAQVMLKLRWTAVAMPNDRERISVESMTGKGITAIQPTVVMAVRESHFFNVRFRNMEPCTLTYELTEKDSGEITSDGIYTAPGREGVFEIRISCAEMPLLSTYAYAVVKKRGAEQDTSK